MTWLRMPKLLGKDNDLYRNGRVTGYGWAVMALSCVFGLGCFMLGRALYRKIHYYW